MIKSREYRGKIDNEYITTFLQRVYNINKDQQCWLTPRFHYGIYFANPLIQYKSNISTEPAIRIWQTEEGQIVGMVNKEDVASTFIQVHPEYMFIEKEMVKWIEENSHHYLYEEEGIHSIKIWCNGKRTSLENILYKYGYKKHEWLEFEHQMQKSPLYRKELDLVVVYKDDTIAAFCTVWFDEKSGIGCLNL